MNKTFTSAVLFAVVFFVGSDKELAAHLLVRSRAVMEFLIVAAVGMSLVQRLVGMTAAVTAPLAAFLAATGVLAILSGMWVSGIVVILVALYFGVYVANNGFPYYPASIKHPRLHMSATLIALTSPAIALLAFGTLRSEAAMVIAVYYSIAALCTSPDDMDPNGVPSEEARATHFSW